MEEGGIDGKGFRQVWLMAAILLSLIAPLASNTLGALISLSQPRLYVTNHGTQLLYT